MNDVIKPNMKPGSLTEYVWELGQENTRMPVQDMVDRVNVRFPKNSYSRQTILALRSQFWITERNRTTPANAKSAAPKPTGKRRKIKRGPYKTRKAEVASDGIAEAPARSADGVKADFRKLVARIGTDEAERLLAAAKEG